MSEASNNNEIMIAQPTTTTRDIFNFVSQNSLSPNTQNKYLPPDMIHQVNESLCKRFNSQLMRAIVNKKMRKNHMSYYEFVTGKQPKQAPANGGGGGA